MLSPLTKLFVFVCLLFILLTTSIYAANPSTRQTVRVGFFQFDGYHQTDLDGNPSSGYGYDLLQMLRPYTSWNFEYIGYRNDWPSMLPMLERGEIDLLSSVTKTPERLGKFDFSEHPVGFSCVRMTVKQGNIRFKIRDYANWNGIRIGMIPNNSPNAVFAKFAKEKNFTYQEILIPNTAELNHALQEGRIDAIVSGSLRRLKNEWVYEQLDTKPFYIAVRKGNRELLNAVNTAIKQLEIQHPEFADELIKRYYADSGQGDSLICFSDIEQAFVGNAEQTKRSFSVLVHPDRMPFSFQKDGQVIGVMADVLDLIKARTGLHFHILPVNDMDDYYRKQQSGEADLVLDMRHDFSHAEKLGYILTDSYISVAVSLLKLKNFSGNLKTLGVVRGSNTEYVVRKNPLPGVDLKPYSSFTAMLDAVKNGECDGCYIFTRSAENIILNDRTGSFALVTAGRIINFSVGVSEQCSPQLYSIVRKAVHSISVEETRSILLAHTASGIQEQSLQDFLVEHSVGAFFIGCLFFLILASALGLVIKSRHKAKQAHAQLEKNTKMWKMLLDSVPIHIFAKDLNKQNRYIFCNKALCDFFGLTESEILEKTNAELFGFDDSNKVQPLNRQSLQSWDTVGEMTADVTDRHGIKRSYRLINIKFSDGKTSNFLLGTATEITELEIERSRAEENAEWFKRTLNSIGDGIITTDAKGNVLMLNPVAERMTGVKSEAAVGRQHEEVFHIVSAIDDEPMPSPITRTIRTGNIVELANHTDLLCVDGTRYHIADSSAPIRDRNGEITGAILVFRDVTEAYLRRDQLKHALNGLEYAASLSHAAYFRISLKDNAVLSCSKEFPSLWPIRDGIMIPEEDFVWPEDLPANQKIYEDLVAGKIDVAILDYRAMMNGKLLNYQIRGRLDNEDRNNPAFVGVIQDVTELKQKELQLTDTLNLWNMVLDTIPEMIFVKEVDDDFRYLISNRSFEQFAGRSHNEVIGNRDCDIFSSEKDSAEFRNWDEIICRENHARQFLESPLNASGKQLYLRTTKVPFTSADGKRLLLGVVVDISAETLHRQNLEKLQAEQADLIEQHNFLLEAMPFYLFIQDADNDFRYVYCNEACAESLGCSVAEVIGKNNYELFYKRDSADISLEYAKKAMASHGMCEDQQIYIDHHGVRRVGRAFRKGIRLADGSRWLLGMVADITELNELAENQKTLNDCFSMVLNPNTQDTLSDVVQKVCLRLEASRGYLIRFDLENKRFLCAAEYFGVSRNSRPLQPQPLDPNHKLYCHMISDGKVCAPDVNDPEVIEKFGLWKEENSRNGVKSLYCAAVVVNGKPWGYLGLVYEDRMRNLSDCDQDFLVAVAHLTGLMLERQYYEKQQAETIEKLRNHKYLMDYGAKLTKGGAFRLNINTGDIHGSGGLTEILPLRDGKILEEKLWVHAADVQDVLHQLKSLRDGNVQQTEFSFRSDYFGERRHYRILLARDEKSLDGKCFGAVQDITEITRQTEKLREAMELWNTVLGLIPVMIFAKDPDDCFKYTIANRAFEKFTGKSSEQIVGHTAAEIFRRQSDLAWIQECDLSVMREEKPQTTNENVVGADGTEHTFRTTRLPYHAADGRIHLLSTCVDVTELETLISNLNVLYSCLELFFKSENASEAIRMVLKNIAERMHANYVYILRLDLEHSIAHTVAEYGTPLILNGVKNFTIDKTEKNLHLLLNGEDCFLADLHDPEQRKIMGGWEPFIDKFKMRSVYFSGIRQDGELWGDLGVIYTGKSRMISELTKQFLRSAAHLIEMLLARQQTATRLQGALERAQAADKAKSLFLASMSHEIRTPLNAVIGFSELLLDGTLPDQDRNEYLSGISSAGNALLALINDVLDLSKLEAGQMVLSPSPVDFSDLLGEVCSIFKQKCEQRKIYLRPEIPQDIPNLLLDKLRIRQILFNLIGNAVKFTDIGGITIHVKFTRDTDLAGTLSFSVRDTGCGISEEDQKNLFQMFVQGNAAVNARMHQTGTGLGLAICQRLIKQMNGTVKLTSELGKGTTFSVVLPQISYSVCQRQISEPKDMPIVDKTKILLVDDVPMNLKVMSAMLKKIDQETLQAANGRDALDILKKEPVDFVLTDLWMPEMNGAELARKIRQKTEYSGIRIAAVTADTGSGESFDMSIFDAVITKPITISKLKQFLMKYYSGSENLK